MNRCPIWAYCWADPPDGVDVTTCPHADPHERTDTCGSTHPDCPQCVRIADDRDNESGNHGY